MPRPPRRNPPPVGPAARPSAGGGDDGGRFFGNGNGGGGGDHRAVVWTSFLRRIERKRRLLRGSLDGPTPSLPNPGLDYYARATFVSFRLDGHDVGEAEVRAALGVDETGGAAGVERPALQLRSRLSQRLRHHAAILHHVENDVRKGVALAPDGVVRWYTAVSAGLSTNAIGPRAAVRLEELVRRMRSPNVRTQAAIHEVATAHVRVLNEPLFPSFNGIVARLLLRYHLGRCGLPAITFDPARDAGLSTVDAMVGRLVELLDQSYDALLKRP